MSTNQTTEQDQQFFEAVDKLDAAKTTNGEYLALALQLGISPQLLSRVANRYFQVSGDGKLPTPGLHYIPGLKAAGWNSIQIRDFLLNECFAESNDQFDDHLAGFWHDDHLWDLYDADTFVSLMTRFAATHRGPWRILTEEGYDALAAHLGPLRDTTQEYQRNIREIERAAVNQLFMPADKYQFRKMLQFLATGRDDKARVNRLQRKANEVGHWGWSIVFRGFVLAIQPYSGYESSLLRQELYTILRRQSRAAAASTYRWLAEGFAYWNSECWDVHIEQMDVQNIFTNEGWHFARTTESSGRIKATFNVKGQRLTVWHVPGDEPLTSGETVMVHQSDLEGKTPRHQPGGKVYEFSLTPARRPTPEQLADPIGQFPTR